MRVPGGLCAYPITPADADGRVDAGGVRRLVARLAGAGADAIGLLGSTGTYAYLDRRERRRAVEAAIGAAGQVPLLVGVGALRTDEAVRLAGDARAAGAAAGLLAMVSYTPPTEDEIVEHVAAVARDSRLPLCLYDNPVTTRVRLGPALIGRLARLPGVVAVKVPAGPADSVAGELAVLRDALPATGIDLGCSGDWHAAEALLAGFSTWHAVAAGLFPAPCLAIARAAQAGDGARARALDAALAPLWDLFRAHSSLRVMLAAARLTGLCAPEPPRPLLPLPPAAEAEVEAVLDRLALR